MENQSNIEEEAVRKENYIKLKALFTEGAFLKWFYFGLTIALVLTLPFHYDIDELKVFPKDNLSFSHTFFRTYDVNKLIDDYNNAPLIEKNELANEPFYRKLVENGYIIDKKDTTSNQGN